METMKEQIEIVYPEDKDYKLILTPSETRGVRYTFTDGWRNDYPIFYGKDSGNGKKVGWDNPEYFPANIIEWAYQEIIKNEYKGA